MTALSIKKLREIKNSTAFSIPEAQRKKLNQHCTEYTFKDGSILKVHCTISLGIAFDAQHKEVLTEELRVNKQGA